MKKIKKILVPLACNLLLTPNSFEEPLQDTRKIICTKQDITLLTHTSNNIMRVKSNGDYFYFRECKRHTEIHKYVADEIDFYYTHIHPEFTEDRLFIEKALLKKENFNKFINMGMSNDFSAGAYNFLIGKGGAYIGLNDIQGDMEERVKDFVQFIWGNLFSYKLNVGVKVNHYQIYNAVRSIATYRLSVLLGIEYLIPKTEYVLLTIDNRTTLFGTMMDEAPGICVEKWDGKSRKEICTPVLQHALNNLNILDVICLEKDHRPGNYNVILDNGKGKGVVAFDNDSPNSFGIGGVSFGTYAGCSPWVVKNSVNRPYIDCELANNIINIKEEELDNIFGDLLNRYQLLTLKIRIKKVKKILLSMPHDCFITENMWSEDTIRKEISGNYGDTYLIKFLQEHEGLYQPWIKH